jgi:hypothetical protein
MSNLFILNYLGEGGVKFMKHVGGGGASYKSLETSGPILQSYWIVICKPRYIQLIDKID